MAERWLGLTATKDTVIIVDATIPDDDGPISINADDTWRVQQGDRSSAYNVLYQQCLDYVSEHAINQVVVKASAVSGAGPATLALLLGAEVRGIVLAAASAHCSVKALSKSSISKTYGARKVDEYLADNQFWNDNTTGGKLRKCLARRRCCLSLQGISNGRLRI